MATTDTVRADLERFGPEHFLYERYHRGQSGGSSLLSLYYALKPAIPRRLQLALRRAYAPRQAARTFPAWPIEPLLVERQEAELLSLVLASGVDAVPIVNYWPWGKGFACVLTHDVEGPRGIENIERVLEVERRHGFVSSWNFVAEWYDIPDGLFDLVRASGCEVGLHGIRHDGRLFQSRERFESDLPKLRAYARAWAVDGFRSPATGRRAEWMHELPVAYDSSFPDSDPFEPQPGGCCSIFPFWFGDVVELPITLPQDHTLFEVLRERSIGHWVRKSEWIAAHHGLITLITHPDYLADPELLELYESFLVYLRGLERCWHALTRDVAAWWRMRARLRCEATDSEPRITGAHEPRATVAWARRRDDGELELEIPAGPRVCRKRGAPPTVSALMETQPDMADRQGAK
jgi:peptidoglycan/xylan/chitin deacetylase (PgdA/CDA1 family)